MDERGRVLLRHRQGHPALTEAAGHPLVAPDPPAPNQAAQQHPQVVLVEAVPVTAGRSCVGLHGIRLREVRRPGVTDREGTKHSGEGKSPEDDG